MYTSILMQNLLFINTFFEEELCSSSLEISPFDWLKKHPLYLQLHYLSVLVNDVNEVPLLCYEPEPCYFSHLNILELNPPSPVFFSNYDQKKRGLSSWGASSSLKKWAHEQGLTYNTPHLATVRDINSKAFSHRSFPKLTHSTLISEKDSLLSWWNSFKGPRVLKTIQGSSGRGHFISLGDLSDIPKALLFLEKNKNNSPTIVAEPWVERILDFSSQWQIHEDGSFDYLGSTICENSSKGVYHKSTTGPEDFLFKEHLPFLKEHLMYAKSAIEHIKSIGFFGNIGFDAMIYHDPKTGEPLLIPILEVNARKTMGWVALKLYKKLKTEQELSIRYTSATKDSFSLLPSAIICPKTGAKTSFPKQLILDRNPI